MTPERQPHFQSLNYTGLAPGPALIVCGAVHGNETCGTRAIGRVIEALDTGALRIKSGSVTFVPVANPLAYARGERCGERNLNRKLVPTNDPQDFEDRVANWLCPLLARHDVLLDLHSFQASGIPFAMIGPRNNDGAIEPFAHSKQEREWARHLGVHRFVDGWLACYGQGVMRRTADPAQAQEQLRYGVGTTEYMRSQGGYAITLECGQHDDPEAPEVAYRAIMNTLAFHGLIDAPRPSPVALDKMEALSITEVVDKASVNDHFARDWSSFDPVNAGQLIGTYGDGRQAHAPADGMILFPHAAASPGHEWYYLTRPNPDFYAD
jgi:predicted deacylase